MLFKVEYGTLMKGCKEEREARAKGNTFEGWIIGRGLRVPAKMGTCRA